ncbi:helix-turn-helix domain-containing protein [Noviherbaspirillum pedocola]|uniref:Helix-turn-helix domain-containing protein n=1 Tax=Noviherbaspirillum pedocola TaxID=2801341 RepID=A0A934W5M3_9BURK|nr:helix-turn-helix domain-containing protein [Noviherbaspirillum pedocola]MBK4735117.1 helix-turn-helix domain-containing protein [Noviherbaspirillum pedocola]
MGQTILTETQLGHLLQGYRKTRRLNQTQLAQRAGMSQARLSTLELHPGRITVAQLLRMTAALGLEITIVERPADYPLAQTESDAPRVAENPPLEW